MYETQDVEVVWRGLIVNNSLVGFVLITKHTEVKKKTKKNIKSIAYFFSFR